MKRIILLLAVLTTVISACQKGGTFGEDFEATDPMTVDALYDRLESTAPISDAVVEGTIDQVCQVKGCWMTLTASDGSAMRVTFKDYGFFVPKNISGRKVVMKGTGMISTTSVDDQQHYAEDAGKSAEEIAAITEPLREYTFEASGVKLLN